MTTETNATNTAAPAKKKLKNKRDKTRRLSNLKKGIKESHFHRYIQHDVQGYERYLAKGGVQLYSEKELAELKTAVSPNACRRVRPVTISISRPAVKRSRT